MHHEELPGSSQRTTGARARFALLGAALASAGCGAGFDAPSDDDQPATAQVSEELTRERNGTVIFNAENRNADYRRTLRGYAASIQTRANLICSGAMIGPNVLITAGHCDAIGNDLELNFLMNRAEKYTTFRRDVFTCSPLLRAFPDTDLMLYHCPARDGVNPGDKYGYLDLEVAHTATGALDVAASRARAVVDTPVRTFWYNNLVEPTAVGTAVFVSTGKITSRELSTGWPSIQGGCGSAAAPILRTDQWVRTGVSGSSTLSARNRIIGGPTSTASASADGASGLNTNAIIDYLTRTVITNPDGLEQCNGDPGRRQLARTVIEGLGLDADNYVGAVDKNANGMFDLHEDVEAGRLLTAADFYWLGFESYRRNKAWRQGGTPAPVFTISPTDENSGSVELSRPASIEHTTLNLKDGQRYLLRAVAHTTAGATLALFSGTKPFFLIPQEIVLPAGFGGRISLSLTGRGAGHALQLRALLGSVRLSNLTLVRDGASYAFRTFDERLHWRTGTSLSGNALFIPTGENDASDLIDFSMGVLPGTPSGNGGLRFGAFSNRVCFSARMDPRLVATDGIVNPRVRVRFKDATGSVTREVGLTSSWVRSCVDGPGTSAANPELWFEAPSAGYLVDNVSITGWDI